MKASKSVRYLCQVALALGSVLASGTPAHGQGAIPDYSNAKVYDPREIALLPRYCIYTQGFRQRVPGGRNQVEIDRWYEVMGPTFHHMHHYCWGLMHTNAVLYNLETSLNRMYRLEISLDEFDYVIRAAPPNFVLLPEIFTKKGENLIRMDKGPLGILDLQRAIDLKPDYWPPYAYISDYYRKIGDVVSARKWLETGLSVMPNTKALTQRLAELDAPKDIRKTAPGPARKPAATPPPG